MESHLKRTAIIFLSFICILLALLGVLYVFDVVTMSQLKDYMTKVSVAALIVALASIGVNLLLSANKKP